MCFHILRVTVLSSFLIGGVWRVLWSGEELASATEARISMKRLTHNNCRGVNTGSEMMQEATKVVTKATTLAVI